ncbi:SDR family NAD(P)-dependent oxidoreductase [Microbacterium sp. zg.B48]|uniref:SDR family NAD(P)-dependent oxidoreductase n=1 Tax=Microbacterium sp. zg.B48 TaxID=2969408 RepID=UPI0035A96B29
MGRCCGTRYAFRRSIAVIENEPRGAAVWVTGAGGGIGRAVARHLLSRGHRIFLTDLDERQVVETARSWGSERVSGFACDVADPVACEDAVRHIVSEAGTLDVLFHSAATMRVHDVLDDSPDIWRSILRVNVEGTAIAGIAAARQMRGQKMHDLFQRRGLIINVGSPADLWPRPRYAAYGASKAAVRHWTMSLAAALEPHAVSVALLYPGAVLDGMYRQIVEGEAALEGRNIEEIVIERAAQVPQGRYQNPEDIGPFVSDLIDHAGLRAAGKAVWTSPLITDIA